MKGASSGRPLPMFDPLRRPASRHRATFDKRPTLPALLNPHHLDGQSLRDLRDWLSGSCAMRPVDARRLLDKAIEGKSLVEDPPLHWRAVKARIAGDANWPQMGFKLLLDEGHGDRRPNDPAPRPAC